MFDIIRFCKDHNITYALKGKQISHGWVGLPDVFNKGPYDTDFHLGFNPHGDYLNSWIDGAHSLESWLKEVAPGKNHWELIEEYDTVVDQRFKLKKKENAVSLKCDFPSALESSGAIAYLKGRKFDPEYYCNKYDLRWGGITGYWKYRIIIPIKVDGVIVSWQGRYICKDKDTPRYITLRDEDSIKSAKSVLYNYDNCPSRDIVLVEGPFNVMRWGDNSCASLGTAFTEEQVQALSKKKSIKIIFDSEVKAQMKARKLASRLSSLKVNVEIIDLESGDKDIADHTDEEIKKIKKELDVN